MFRYAIATGRAERDPAADLALPPVNEKHHAAITAPKAIGELLRAIVVHEDPPDDPALADLDPEPRRWPPPFCTWRFQLAISLSCLSTPHLRGCA